VVVVEGVFDYLSALIAWPELLVLGADGAALIPHIAKIVAPAVASAARRLFLVPHDDDAGCRACVAAGREAVIAGLRLDQHLFVLGLGLHGDLNDAFRAGAVPDAR
jgi:hypothetical protein